MCTTGNITALAFKNFKQLITLHINLHMVYLTLLSNNTYGFLSFQLKGVLKSLPFRNGSIVLYSARSYGVSSSHVTSEFRTPPLDGAVSVAMGGPLRLADEKW